MPVLRLLLLLVLVSATARAATVGSWSPQYDASTERVQSSIVMSGTGNVLALGTNSAYVYNPYRMRMREIASHCQRVDVDCLARALVELPSRQVLSETYYMDGRADPEVHLFDPRTETWSGAPGMPALNLSESVTLLSSGRVLFAGGFTFRNAPGDQGSVSLDYEWGQGSFSPGTSFEYDAGTGVATATSNMVTPRSNHAATLLYSGQVLVTGGEDNMGRKLASAELYDPRTRVWTSAGNMSQARGRHQAIRLNSGSVMVLGDAWDSDGKISVDIYDPYNRRWLKGPSLYNSRPRAVILLYTGEVFVASDDNVDIYDPQANVWLDAPQPLPYHNMTIANQFVRLQTGRVLNASYGFFEEFAR